MLTGAGIGGEYAAVNATIQELIPARRRGFTDLVVNGSFWLGAAIGAIGALVVLDPAVMPPEIRLALRLHHRRRAGLHRAAAAPLPAGEPALADDARPAGGGRTRGRRDRAARRARNRPPAAAGAAPGAAAAHATCSHGSAPATRALFTDYRRRTMLGIALMAAQAFCYNAVFFTYALILTRFYAIPSGNIGWFMLPFAVGNFLGPLLLGRLFDTLGRRLMITATYALSGVLMALTGWLFALGCAGRDAADAGLDGDLLRRLGRGELRLSDGRRELPAGDARDRHRAVLRVRHRRRRRRRPGAVRRADRDRRRACRSCGAICSAAD